MLHVVTFLWGNKYDPIYVDKLASGVARNLKQEHRFMVLTERKRSVQFGHGIERHAIKDLGLTHLPHPGGCLARIRLFNSGWQEARAIKPGERIVCLDVDTIVTGPLDPLFDVDCEFRILQDFNSTNPCPYNGSLWMFRAGERHDVWKDLMMPSPDPLVNYRAMGAKWASFPDDQGWFWLKFPHALAFSPADGCYAFKKKHWPAGDDLPAGARFVTFPGWRGEPKFFERRVQTIPWIRQHWCL